MLNSFYLRVQNQVNLQISFSSSTFTPKRLKRMDTVKALKELGYGFNEEGELRKLDSTGSVGSQPFQFNISDNHQECQAHYEMLGAAVTPYVYHLLETKLNLVKLPVPKDGLELDKGTFIFTSKDYATKDVLLILIHGSGVVRAGQWARSLIINENLNVGSQIPYIKRAMEDGYGVMVLNTNDNYTIEGENIPYSRLAEEHATYVWKTYVIGTIATSILIVAHSYGGVVTLTLADKVKEDFEKRVKAVALTDSVHGHSELKVSKFLMKVSKNWAASSEPVDTPLKTPEHDIPRVSAGHSQHEMTSHSSMNAIFRFFDHKLKKYTSKT